MISNCKIAIIVFSINYANSRLCLQELEKITECCRSTTGLIVLPVFYDGVYPSDGTLQRGMVGEDFYEFVDRISMDEMSSQEEDSFLSWVADISKATEYSGSTHFVQIPEYR
jgi:hypothetical protein